MVQVLWDRMTHLNNAGDSHVKRCQWQCSEALQAVLQFVTNEDFIIIQYSYAKAY